MGKIMETFRKLRNQQKGKKVYGSRYVEIEDDGWEENLTYKFAVITIEIIEEENNKANIWLNLNNQIIIDKNIH